MKKLVLTLFIFGLILSIGFGIGVFSEWKTLASKQDNATKLNKVYKAQINSIDLDVDNSDVEIKRGSTFSIKEKGNSDKKINSDVKNGEWHISDQDHQSNINFRIGYMTKHKLVITVPKAIDQLTVKGDSGDVTIDNIISKKSDVTVDSSDIFLKDSKLGKLKVNNDSGDISTSHIEFTNGKIENDSGDIELSKCVPDQPLYVSNDSGDITLNYQQHPKNTTFIAHNDSGDSNINNKEFKRHRIGEGDNNVELFNDSGDINVQ